MIKDNIIYFGYGDIAVGCNEIGDITFQQFKPSQNIGSDVDSNIDGFEYLSELITLDFSKKDYVALSNIVDSKVRIYNLDGYILDFTNFNEGSVNVILKYMRHALRLKIYIFNDNDFNLAC